MEIIALYNEYEIPDTLPKYNNLCFYNFFPTDNIGLSILLYHTLICLSLKICLFYKTLTIAEKRKAIFSFTPICQ